MYGKVLPEDAAVMGKSQKIKSQISPAV